MPYRKEIECLFFKDDICLFGDKCYFMHSTSNKPGSTLPEISSIGRRSVYTPTICFWSIMTYQKRYDRECYYFKSGTCPFGNSCGFMHSPRNKPDSTSPEISSSRKDQDHECRNHNTNDTAGTTLPAADRKTPLDSISRKKSCAICLEDIKETSSPEKQIVGILENHNHIYCMDCVIAIEAFCDDLK